MEYTQEMNLQSASGFSMPFVGKNEEVVLLKTYGEQPDGSVNHGIELETDRYALRAVADGIVSAIGSSKEMGMYQVTKYGRYEVTYGNIATAKTGFGKRVQTGDIIAVSGKRLRLEVRFDGEELDPIEFLRMLFGNVKMQDAGDGSLPDFETLDIDVPTDFDDDREEIEELMSRFYHEYLMEVYNGLYRVPLRTEESLRNIFSFTFSRNYFGEEIPSNANPMGLSERAAPIAAKVQNLLIGDFLNFLALRHQIFLSSLSATSKKKDLTKP